MILQPSSTALLGFSKYFRYCSLSRSVPSTCAYPFSSAPVTWTDRDAVALYEQLAIDDSLIQSVHDCFGDLHWNVTGSWFDVEPAEANDLCVSSRPECGRWMSGDVCCETLNACDRVIDELATFWVLLSAERRHDPWTATGADLFGFHDRQSALETSGGHVDRAIVPGNAFGHETFPVNAGENENAVGNEIVDETEIVVENEISDETENAGGSVNAAYLLAFPAIERCPGLANVAETNVDRKLVDRYWLEPHSARWLCHV